MVDIAQLVSASDCGSEGRGFESHYPPHKRKGHPFGCPFLLSDNGIRKAVKKSVRWTLFRPWENLWKTDGTPQGVLAVFHLLAYPTIGLCIVSTYHTFTRNKNQGFLPWSFVFWKSVDNGIRKAVKKTVRWTVFRPWENPWKADGAPQGVLAAFHPVVHLPLDCALYQLVVPLP